MNANAAPNPGRVVPVDDYSPATLTNIVAHLEASSAFEHFIYRESELDAVWRLLDIALERGDTSGVPPARLNELRDAARDAHDLVADEQAAAAAARLRQVL